MTEVDIAATACLFGDPVRAAMLNALLDRECLSAGELAFAANISPQTASFHLARLTSAELLKSERKGRNRVYRLAGPGVAGAMESLAAISRRGENHVDGGNRFASERMHQLKECRTCYDHLAGRTAVLLHDAIFRLGYLRREGEKQYALTKKGRTWAATFDGECGAAKRSPLIRPCLDWTERRPHLAGRLAARLLDSFFEQGWIARIRDTRAVRITERGLAAFENYGVILRATKTSNL